MRVKADLMTAPYKDAGLYLRKRLFELLQPNKESKVILVNNIVNVLFWVASAPGQWTCCLKQTLLSHDYRQKSIRIWGWMWKMLFFFQEGSQKRKYICQTINLKHAAACGTPSTFLSAIVPHVLQPIMFQQRSVKTDSLMNPTRQNDRNCVPPSSSK